MLPRLAKPYRQCRKWCRVNALSRIKISVTTALIVCTRALLNPTALGVSVICLNAEGKVLLVRTRLGAGWSLPGGGVSRGEAPMAAAVRELQEETGHSGGSAASLFGIYTKRVLFATNHIAVYRVDGGEIDFKPNFEIREVCWADPMALPADTYQGTRHRLAELAGAVPQRAYW